MERQIVKDAARWLSDLAYGGCDHKPDCICDRCKNGLETFLLASDIAEIQRDAREGMVPMEDVKQLVDVVEWEGGHHPGGVVETAVKSLRAKHPNLFTK